MFAKQIASECESRGFCPRIVDMQDVVENDDGDAVDAAANESGYEGTDEDGALIRASLSHPHYRDGDDEGGDAGRSKALFFVATYGEGEPTDNAQQFVEAMKGKSGLSNIYKIDDSIHGGDANIDDDSVEKRKGMEERSGSGLISVSSQSLEDEAAEPLPSLRDEAFLRDVDYAVFGLGNKQYEHYNNMSRFMDAALEKCGARRVADLGLGDDDDDLEGDFEAWKDIEK